MAHTAHDTHHHAPIQLEYEPGLPLTNGKLIIWLFLSTEIMFFAGLIGTYIVLRFGAPTWPTPHEVHLSEPVGAFNTFVLICSSVTVVLAFEAAKANKTSAAKLWIFATFVLGSIFLGVKAWEYQAKFSHGIYAQSTGGGGGSGGFAAAFAGSFSTAPDSNSAAVGVSVGGSGAGGGDGKKVTVSSSGAITTAGDSSNAIYAQSIGGGGGNGGFAASGTIAIATKPDSNAFQAAVAVGGSGGAGGSAVNGAYTNWDDAEPSSVNGKDCAFVQKSSMRWWAWECTGWGGHAICEWRGHQSGSNDRGVWFTPNDGSNRPRLSYKASGTTSTVIGSSALPSITTRSS